MDCDMSPPVKARFDVVHFQLAVMELTSQHSIDDFTPRADCQHSFASFLELEACCKGGSLNLKFYYKVQMTKCVVPRLFCAPLPVNA